MTYAKTGAHRQRAQTSMMAWFSGAAKNFANCQRQAGATVTSIMADIIQFTAVTEPTEPPLDITALKVARFLDAQIDTSSRVALVSCAAQNKDRVYQVVPDPTKRLPTDRNRNNVVVPRKKIKSLEKRAAATPTAEQVRRPIHTHHHSIKQTCTPPPHPSPTPFLGRCEGLGHNHDRQEAPPNGASSCGQGPA